MQKHRNYLKLRKDSLSCNIITAIVVLTTITLTSCKDRSELMKITPSDAYNLQLSSPKYPDATFSLWLPEIIIFDHDLDRAECVEMENWYEYSDNSIIVTGETEGKQSVSFECKLTPMAEDEILMTLDIKNTGKESWSQYAQLAICLSPDQEVLHDSLGTRTFIHTRKGSLTTISEIGNAGDFNHYPVGIRTDPVDPDERNQVVDGYVARTSQDGKLTISICWDESSRVDVNPGGLKCIHSHPAIGPLAPGESLTRLGIILIGESSVQDNYELMKARLLEYSKATDL